MEEANSKRYDFFLRGNGEKGVLLIHGITGTPSEMRYLGRKLHKAGISVFCNTLPYHCSTLNDLKKVSWGEIFDSCVADFLRLKQECKKVFVAGISMGALMAIHLSYKFPSEVGGIIAFAPTLFYDGWALPKAKCLMSLAWHVPFLRKAIDIREGWPYGLKDEVMREHIARFYKNAKASAFDNKVLLFGSPFFPLACLYQHHLFAAVAKKELSSVKTPILVIHAREDDMTSLKNARYIMDHIGSGDKSLLILEDSYHMITIDNEKDKVAREAIKFLERL